MAEQERAIEVGDRFEDSDKRNPGRVVQVRLVTDGGEPRAKVQTEVHPTNPEVVGRHSWIRLATLRRRFTRLSH